MKMKKINIKWSFMLAIAALVVLQACKKENDYPSQVVKLSFPVMTLNGNAILVLNRGDVFTDPGCSWKDTVTGETGTVNSNATIPTTSDTIVVISYTAVNKYGMKSSITRTVAVTGIPNSLDISGAYLRAATGQTANISKIDRGVFFSDNIGGNSTGDVGFFMIKTDSSILIPEQPLASSGTADFAQQSINYGPPITIKYQILASGYGTSVRTFVKQ
jgi:Domain of unknown function (DUF5011)